MTTLGFYVQYSRHQAKPRKLFVVEPKKSGPRPPNHAAPTTVVQISMRMGRQKATFTGWRRRVDVARAISRRKKWPRADVALSKQTPDKVQNQAIHAPLK